MQYEARNVDDMLALGQSSGTQASAGTVWILNGDLGAGKTHWTKGFVLGVGSNADVTSPTFGLIHEYRDGKIPVFHFDFYRLNGVEELYALGWDEYIDSGGIIIAEWGSRFPEAFPTDAIQVKITVEADGNRLVRIDI